MDLLIILLGTVAIFATTEKLLFREGHLPLREELGVSGKTIQLALQLLEKNSLLVGDMVLKNPLLQFVQFMEGNRPAGQR